MIAVFLSKTGRKYRCTKDEIIKKCDRESKCEEPELLDQFHR